MSETDLKTAKIEKPMEYIVTEEQWIDLNGNIAEVAHIPINRREIMKRSRDLLRFSHKKLIQP